jgi:hypothetical protein
MRSPGLSEGGGKGNAGGHLGPPALRQSFQPRILRKTLGFEPVPGRLHVCPFEFKELK